MAETKAQEKAVVPVERRPAGLFEQMEREMADMRRQMHRAFGWPLWDGGLFRRPILTAYRPRGLKEIAWTPTVDAYEKDGTFFIKAELPGVKKEDVQVSLSEGVLTIGGKRQEEQEVKEEDYHARERFSGSFSRSFAMPDGVEADKIRAEYKDGVLEVQVPLPVEQKPQTMTVPVKG
jgi:HSP20 family protein